ncbi:MAG: phosphatase PAP2 family protein [Oscillospiraceae bacterium]|nr:phosphatase PAP2 family protein [Oscillospiraceae bacterium]
MGNTFYFEWEVRAMEWLQSHGNAFLTALAEFFTMFGEEMLLIALLGTLYWSLDKGLGKRLTLSVLTVFIWSALLKGAVLRRRPYMDHEGIDCLKAPHNDGDLMDPAIQGYSCPSMHSSLSASGFGTLAYALRKRVITVLSVLIPLCIGSSRFYLGVHYPTDVLSGWVLGALSVLTVQALLDRFGRKRLIYLGILIMALPGMFYCRDMEYFSCLGVTIGFIGAFAFEERFVGFEGTRVPHKFILRPLFGLVVFLMISQGLKLPFDREFLASPTAGAFAVRVFRYAAAVFVSVGVYPLAFDKSKVI